MYNYIYYIVYMCNCTYYMVYVNLYILSESTYINIYYILYKSIYIIGGGICIYNKVWGVYIYLYIQIMQLYLIYIV